MNIKESPDVVTGFMQEKGVSYPVVLDSEGEVASKYGVRGIPDIYLVDHKGIIRYHGHTLPSVDEVEKTL